MTLSKTTFSNAGASSTFYQNQYVQGFKNTLATASDINPIYSAAAATLTYGASNIVDLLGKGRENVISTINTNLSNSHNHLIQQAQKGQQQTISRLSKLCLEFSNEGHNVDADNAIHFFSQKLKGGRQYISEEVSRIKNPKSLQGILAGRQFTFLEAKYEIPDLFAPDNYRTPSYMLNTTSESSNIIVRQVFDKHKAGSIPVEIHNWDTFRPNGNFVYVSTQTESLRDVIQRQETALHAYKHTASFPKVRISLPQVSSPISPRAYLEACQNQQRSLIQKLNNKRLVLSHLEEGINLLKQQTAKVVELKNTPRSLKTHLASLSPTRRIFKITVIDILGKSLIPMGKTLKLTAGILAAICLGSIAKRMWGSKEK